MNLHRCLFPLRRLLALVLSLVSGFWLLSGCNLDRPRVVWSPDGARALVLGSEGLYVCDATGRLSPLLVPQVRSAVWLPDSLSALCVVKKSTGDWAQYAGLFPHEEVAAIEEKAKEFLSRTESGLSVEEAGKNLKGIEEAVIVFLRSQDVKRLKARFSEKEWADMAELQATWSELQLVTLKLGEAPAIRVLGKAQHPYEQLSVSPDGQALAYTSERRGEHSLNELWVELLAKPEPLCVSNRSASHVAWTPDSRSLVFASARGTGSELEEGQLGVLMLRMVREAGGGLKLAEEIRELASLVFHPATQVKCLRDGRIIFNAAELRLPCAKADMNQASFQLFCLDPARSATLSHVIPLPQLAALGGSLESFELNSAETRLFVAMKESAVAVLTLSTGEVQSLQTAVKEGYEGCPSWRGADELCYYKPYPVEKGKPAARPLEVVLRRGQEDFVLSREWSDEFLRGLTKRD